MEGLLSEFIGRCKDENVIDDCDHDDSVGRSRWTHASILSGVNPNGCLFQAV